MPVAGSLRHIPHIQRCHFPLYINYNNAVNRLHNPASHQNGNAYHYARQNYHAIQSNYYLGGVLADYPVPLRLYARSLGL